MPRAQASGGNMLQNALDRPRRFNHHSLQESGPAARRREVPVRRYASERAKFDMTPPPPPTQTEPLPSVKLLEPRVIESFISWFISFVEFDMIIQYSTEVDLLKPIMLIGK